LVHRLNDVLLLLFLASLFAPLFFCSIVRTSHLTVHFSAQLSAHVDLRINCLPHARSTQQSAKSAEKKSKTSNTISEKALLTRQKRANNAHAQQCACVLGQSRKERCGKNLHTSRYAVKTAGTSEPNGARSSIHRGAQEGDEEENS